jgi:hypothetical protein
MQDNANGKFPHLFTFHSHPIDPKGFMTHYRTYNVTWYIDIRVVQTGLASHIFKKNVK